MSDRTEESDKSCGSIRQRSSCTYVYLRVSNESNDRFSTIRGTEACDVRENSPKPYTRCLAPLCRVRARSVVRSGGSGHTSPQKVGSVGSKADWRHMTHSMSHNPHSSQSIPSTLIACSDFEFLAQCCVASGSRSLNSHFPRPPRLQRKADAEH